MQHANTARIFEQATRWIEALRDGAGDRKAFFAWLAESPRHVEELNFALALGEEIAGLTPQQKNQIERLAQSLTGTPPLPAANVVALNQDDYHDGAPTTTAPATGRRAPGHRSRLRTCAIAAGLIVAAVAVGMAMGLFGGDTYSTRTGEQRTVQLPDGSTVHLNARSRLQVRFSRNERGLELLEGEALFKVVHDAARPFRVRSDKLLVQAVGTQFNVHRRISGTVVSVLEGAVRVEERQDADGPATVELLRTGEAVRVQPGGGIDKERLTNTTAVTAWRQHRLIFQDDSLADIAAEFNRHNLSPQIRVEGDIAAARHFAGTFDADAPEALIEALKADNGLLIQRLDGQIVISARAGS